MVSALGKFHYQPHVGEKWVIKFLKNLFLSHFVLQYAKYFA